MDEASAGRGQRRHLAMLVVVGMLALAVLAGAAALWPRGRLPQPPGARGQPNPTRLQAASLTRVTTTPCKQAEPGLPGSTCIRVVARLAGGRQVGFETTDPTGHTFRAGQRVRLAVLEQPGAPTFYTIQDFQRGRPMLLLAVLFGLAVVAFGRWQGVRSLLGLGLSFLVIVGFVVPAILHGHAPVPVALVGAMAIMLLSLYLAHGTGPKTTAAVVGTALALGLTAALSAAFVAAASLTGLASEEAVSANFVAGGLSLRGLLLAGVIVGSLGVLDDVTMSQASLVFELRRADPAADAGQLVRAGLAVGRDHIAATVNTLFLAYAGASLPLLVLFVTGGDPFGTVITSEAVAVEVVRALCGSVGLIAAVPLTTVLAALLAPEAAAQGSAGLAAPARPSGGPAPSGRAPYGPARGLGPDGARVLFERALDLHGPRLARAVVGVGDDWPGLERPPAEVLAAAADLERMAAESRRSAGPWYRRMVAGATVQLDPGRAEQLDLLRRYGAYSAATRVWVEGDPDPVVRTAEGLEAPRLILRLDRVELERLRGLLADAGLPAALVPRRAGAGRGRSR